MKAKITNVMVRGRLALACVLAGGLTLLTMPATAQFGGIVHDPLNNVSLVHIWQQDISTYAKMIQEYNELVKIYTTGTAMYQQAIAMSQMFGHGQRMNWSTLALTGFNDYTRNKYGETALWPQMVNGQPSMAPQAWSMATMRYGSTGVLNSSTMSKALIARLASMEVVDGSASKCLQDAAQYRQNTSQNSAAFASIKTDQQNANPLYNALIQQLNLANGFSSQRMDEARSQGQIHACEVEQQAIQNKIQRDQIAEEMNVYQDDLTAEMQNQSGLDDPTPTVNSWLPK